MAMVVAAGVTSDGNREILGCDLGDSESEGFWQQFLAGLRARGLSGVRLVTADARLGLAAAAGRGLQGAAPPALPGASRPQPARGGAPQPPAHGPRAVADRSSRNPTPQPCAPPATTSPDGSKPASPTPAPLMADTKEEILAFSAIPKAHWRKIWVANPIERINKETKRRSRVVGTFPNEAPAIRLIRANLADLHDQRQTTQRRYLSEDPTAQLRPPAATITTAELTTR